MKAANSSNVYIINTASQTKGTKYTSFHRHAQAKGSLVTKVLFNPMPAKSTSFNTHAYTWIELGGKMN